MVAHRTWHFHTARTVRAHGVHYEWTWRAMCDKQEVAAAAQSFLTLYECVADAKRNGFTAMLILPPAFASEIIGMPAC